jgi:hypothetical protein
MRSKLTTLAEVVGAALVAVGAGMIYVPAGVVVAGVALAGVGYLAGDS